MDIRSWCDNVVFVCDANGDRRVWELCMTDVTGLK
jgi:hypothetical protein